MRLRVGIGEEWRYSGMGGRRDGGEDQHWGIARLLGPIVICLSRSSECWAWMASEQGGAGSPQMCCWLGSMARKKVALIVHMRTGTRNDVDEDWQFSTTPRGRHSIPLHSKVCIIIATALGHMWPPRHPRHHKFGGSFLIVSLPQALLGLDICSLVGGT
jgi:hypothetical protein